MDIMLSALVCTKLVQAPTFHVFVYYWTGGNLKTKITFFFTIRETEAHKVKLLPQEHTISTWQSITICDFKLVLSHRAALTKCKKKKKKFNRTIFCVYWGLHQCV